MESNRYIPTGNIQGDARVIPDRGISTGVTDSYGADLSGDATNGQGSIGSASKSDKMDKCCTSDQKMGG